MKQLHRDNLYGWSSFDRARNLDFHSVLWVREGGNVAIDPLPLSDDDADHVAALGGVAWVVVTNSDHLRATADLVQRFRARVAAPDAERETLDHPVDRWLADGDELVPGLLALALDGSKTPGELALVLDGTTLITGDLVRGHRGGALNLLPDPKLRDRAAALASVRRLAALDAVDAVLVGDGWHVFRDGHARLRELLTPSPLEA